MLSSEDAVMCKIKFQRHARLCFGGCTPAHMPCAQFALKLLFCASLMLHVSDEVIMFLAAVVQVVFLHPKDNDGVLMELEEVGSKQST